MLYCAFLVHELGHYIASRLVGIQVCELAVGFGPKLLSFKLKDTCFSLRIIPFGGYNAWERSKLRALNLFKQIFINISGLILNYISFIFSFCIIFKINLLTSIVVINRLIISMISELFTSIELNNIYTPNGNLAGNLSAMKDMGSANSLLMIFAMVNLLLFCLNIIPLPGLDGGKVFEVIARKLLVTMGGNEKTVDKVMYPLYILSFIFLFSPIIVNEFLGVVKTGYNIQQVLLIYVLLSVLILLLYLTLKKTEVYRRIFSRN
jgi:membrane-associated protease RseP (regulator of RpoE activity)